MISRESRPMHISSASFLIHVRAIPISLVVIWYRNERNQLFGWRYNAACLKNRPFSKQTAVASGTGGADNAFAL